MTLKSIGLALFAFAIVLAEQAYAQEFKVETWLERCVLTAPEVQDVETNSGAKMQFSGTSCLTTARRTCQFTEDAANCFSQYIEVVERLSRSIRANFPDKVDAADLLGNRVLTDDKNSIEAYKEYCLNSVESDLAIELLYLPSELRAPVDACKILVPTFELGLLLHLKAQSEYRQSNQ